MTKSGSMSELAKMVTSADDASETWTGKTAVLPDISYFKQQLEVEDSAEEEDAQDPDEEDMMDTEEDTHVPTTLDTIVMYATTPGTVGAHPSILLLLEKENEYQN